MAEASITATLDGCEGLRGPNPAAVAALLRLDGAPEPAEAPIVEVVGEMTPGAPSAALAQLEGLPTVEELFRAWLGGLSRATVRVYRQDLLAFARFAGIAEGAPDAERRRAAVRTILGWSKSYTNRVVKQWIADMNDLGLAPNTQARRVGTLRSVTAQAEELGLLSWRLTTKGPKSEGFRDVRGPTEPEVLRLLEYAGDGREGLRNRAMLGLMCIRGLRRIEVQELRREHFDRPGPRVQVRYKGRKDREWVTIPEQVGTAIGAWVDEEQIIEPDAPLFHPLQRPGAPLNLSGINKIVRKIGERAGVKVWPHALRHSAITMGAEVSGGDIRAVQQLARHQNVQHTMHYIDQWADIGGKLSSQVAERLLGKGPQ